MLRDKLMAGTRDSVLDSFDELNRKKVKKTQGWILKHIVNNSWMLNSI